MGLFIGTEAQLAASRKPKGRSKGGKAFDKEFARQRAKGAKNFTFGGKSYSTKTASGGAAKSTMAAVKPKGAAGPTVLAKKTTALPKPAPRAGLPSQAPVPGKRPDAAAAAVKAVPTPAPGRTGEILRIANRNKTNPPPANNKDVMKRVQESIAAGKNRPAGPRPGSPTGPRGAQYRQGEAPKGYLTNAALPVGAGEPGKVVSYVGRNKPVGVHASRQDYTPRSDFKARPQGTVPPKQPSVLSRVMSTLGHGGGKAQAVAPTIENVSAAARAKAPGSPAGPRGSQVTSSFGQRTSSLLNPPTGATAKADRLPSRATADKTDRLQPKAVAAVKTTMPAKERFGRDKTRTRMSNKTLGLWRSN